MKLRIAHQNRCEGSGFISQQLLLETKKFVLLLAESSSVQLNMALNRHMPETDPRQQDLVLVRRRQLLSHGNRQLIILISIHRVSRPPH